jgi:solute carrier family 8 (sodium/calcium exchanger)
VSTSRAQHRANLLSSLSGGKKKVVSDDPNLLEFGFKNKTAMVLECEGTVKLPITVSRAFTGSATMKYYTRDVTAAAGLRYTHTEGSITFEAGALEKVIEIPVIDNDTWEPEETFEVILQELDVFYPGHTGSMPARLGTSVNTVTIVNDDEPGTLGFSAEEIMVIENNQTVTVGIVRTNGTTGDITCGYTTANDTAVAGRDYTEASGEITMVDKQAHTTIDIQILKTRAREERFKVILSGASPGVKFDPMSDGGDTSAVCDVVLAGGSGGMKCCTFNSDKCSVGIQEWKDKVPAALYCGGGPQEQSECSATDWFFHLLSMMWKVLFLSVPPASLCGGWLCFVLALCNIGIVTGVIGEMAEQLGCCMGIEDEITAITLVALGTSLPDTFASRAAARQDDTADNSIGNVTGSNSVNVFLGLGLPWTMGAFYWHMQGATDEWKKMKAPDGSGETYLTQWGMAGCKSGNCYPDGGFLVPAGSLGFSVGVFSSCAIICLMLLVLMRCLYGGELGGPKGAQTRDSIILASLWMLYIGLSIWQIKSGF